MQGQILCHQCRFWDPVSKGRTEGVCRYNPPTVFLAGMQPALIQGGNPEPVFISKFPPVDPNGWCSKGEGRLQ